jgi:hypothetical protein
MVNQRGKNKAPEGRGFVLGAPLARRADQSAVTKTVWRLRGPLTA